MNDTFQKFRDNYYKAKDYATLYGYVAVGIAAPVAGLRYTVFHDLNNNIGEHILAWSFSAIGSIPVAPFTGGIAAGIGKITVNERQKRRVEKRKSPENIEAKLENRVEK